MKKNIILCLLVGLFQFFAMAKSTAATGQNLNLLSNSQISSQLETANIKFNKDLNGLSEDELQREIFNQESGLTSTSRESLDVLSETTSFIPVTEDLKTNVILSQDYNEKFKNSGKWATHIIFLGKDNTRTVLTSYRLHESIKPASTLKLFTGYLAFLNRSYPVLPVADFNFNDQLMVDKYFDKNHPSLVYMLHNSDNVMADQALVSLVPAGLKKQRDFSKVELLKLGSEYMKSSYKDLQDSPLFHPVNGSGLNETLKDSGAQLNKVTAKLETALLEKIYHSGNYEAFKKLLPQPGFPYGTLKLRLSEASSLAKKIYAKTGTLDQTVSLAGFAETQNGVIIFSIIGDELRLNVEDPQKKAKDLLDSFLTDHIRDVVNRGR